MAFEYGTQGATLDFPNPYRIENQFLAAKAAVLFVVGLTLLLFARHVSESVQVARSGALAVLIIVGAALILVAILDGARLARQLRVYFGRGQPASLAHDVPRDVEGTSDGARGLQKQMRDGALALSEPHGALNGLLHSVVRHLVTAPPVLREFVQVRFANVLAAAGLFLLFLTTWLITHSPASRSLTAVVYVVLGGVLILRTYRLGTQRVVALKPAALAALLVFGLVGTVLVGRVTGDAVLPGWLEALQIQRTCWVLLVSSVLVEALGLLAGRAHLDEPPPASSASHQATLSFNADPNLLLHEVDRQLQTRWVEGIPNRRYTWQPPAVEPTREAGTFAAAVLEETQPMPPEAVRKMDWATCRAYPRFFTLAVLDAVGLLYAVVGGALLVWLGRQLASGGEVPVSLGSIGVIALVVSDYAFGVAHQLWGRLDFDSTLVWVELGGSYARAEVGLGAPLGDRVRSARTVINVEQMTLRTWVVRARSVIFNYRDGGVGSRALVGMSGDLDAAKGWSQIIRDFAAGQSAFVAPSSAEDAARIRQIQQANEHLGGAAGPAALIGASGASRPVADPSSSRFCTACGATLQTDARFCPQCGAKVAADGPAP